MRWIAAWHERLRALVFRTKQETEMDEELRFHLEHETELLREAGLDAREAKREAQLRFGGVERVKEEVREARGLRLLEDLGKDLKFAARGLARRPGFALGVALTLGLGIGATTTIYAIVDGVVLRRLAYEEPAALVAVGHVEAASAPGAQDLGPISLRHYQNLRERTRSFEMLAAINQSRLLPLSTDEGGAGVIRAPEVSSELFEMLGVTPALGRSFPAEEYRVGQDTMVMVTHGAWQRRYGGDPGIIGQPIGLPLGRNRNGGKRAILIGVLPPDFHPLEAFSAGGEAPDFYFAGHADDPRYEGMWREINVLGRLRPGVSLDQARAEVERIGAELTMEFPEPSREDGSHSRDGSRYRMGLNGLQAQTVGASGQLLGLFLGAAGLLLLLAAMNAATLLLARSLDRTREFGVRMALGAGRTRLVRLLMSEAGILSAVGGSIGVVLAYAGVGAFLRYAPASIPRLTTVAVDTRILAVAAVVSLGTGIGVGLLPALRVTRRGPWERLHQASPSFAEPTSRFRALLVGGQMAVAVILLTGAALLFSSFMRMRTLDPGFEATGLVTMAEAYKDSELVSGLPMWQAWDLLLDELRALPGVESVAGTTTMPFESPFWSTAVRLPGDTEDTSREAIAGYAITPGYLKTMGMALLQGRDFDALDGRGAQTVALVNESFVRTQLGGGDPIELVIRWSEGEEETRIVGVVEDVIQMRAEEGFRPAIYVPYTQYNAMAGVHAVIRTTGATHAIVPDLRRVSAWFNPSRQPRIGTMPDRMATTRTSPRFNAMLIGVFALVATLLAAMGLYGSVAHSVGRRQKELGVRMALGADRACVLRMILGQGMRLSMAGLALGTVATLLSTRALTSYLYGVAPNDPATLLTVGTVLLLVSAAACLAPARRATAVDPVTVLKAE
jgi:predicted permease